MGPDGALWFTENGVNNIGRGTACMTETHDFNADCKSDILWKDTSGNTAAWLMNGGSILQAGGYGAVPGWSVVGQRDFNGDGNYDLLWRRRNERPWPE